MIEIKNNYNKIIPPSEVSVNFNIENILEINDYDSTFDVYLSIDITWFDNKLIFHYLKDNKDLNTVAKDEREIIWLPHVHFSFVKSSFLSHNQAKLFIEKRTEPRISGDRSKLNVSETYLGDSNPITFHSEYYLRFLCEFNGIEDYPFGSEICSFDFFLDGRANTETEINCTLKHSERKLIGQYEIKGWNYKHFQTELKNMIRISITLDKRPISILMMTYLPTLLMNIINQATNYITGESKYDLIIEVNITSMVVLATIYVTVSTYLPSTANIKPVEYWLLFSLAYPFLVIITNVILQVSIVQNTENRIFQFNQMSQYVSRFMTRMTRNGDFSQTLSTQI